MKTRAQISEEQSTQKFPSTARKDAKGNFVPCPINQPSAYADSVT